MKIERLVVSSYQTNCYLLTDETTNTAALIDPGDNAPLLCEWIREKQVDLRYILITHGHRDHTFAAPDVKKAFPEAKVYIHADDASGAGFYIYALAQYISDLCYYSEGDTLTLGTLTIKVLHTPGHTEGGVTLLVNGVMFSGDTLFPGSMGRTDFPGGSADKMYASLYRLASLEGDYRVLPGHMDETTLSHEREHNAYLKHAVYTKGGIAK